MEKNITIKDIAKKLKISPSTVSRVLNNKEKNYSEKTREKVLNLVKKYDYTPNLSARGLQGKRTYNIGIMIPEFLSFWSEIYLGIQKVANEMGYNLNLICSNYDPRNEEIGLKNFLDRKIDGLIINTVILNENILEYFIKRNIPVISIEKITDKFKLPFIYYDNYKITEKAIEHLALKGYKKIALICDPPYLYNSKERIRAYKDTLKKLGFAVNENNIITNDSINYWDLSNAADAIENIVFTKQADALLITKDILAIMTIYRLIIKGFKIPEDIGLIGYDDEQLSRHVKPSLSCISTPKFEMGMESMKLLIKLLEKKEVVKGNLELGAQLIVRDSTNRKE